MCAHCIVWFCAVISPVILLGSHASIIIHIDKGLSGVPSSTDQGCTALVIQENNIPNLERNSFITYPNLVNLDLYFNNIQRIKDDAFSGLNFLLSLRLQGNHIIQLPSSFGPPTQSLIDVNLWRAFSYAIRPPISYPFFSNFNNLKILNLGHNTHRNFNASLLPVNLRYINLGYADLIEFPDFVSYTPNLESIAVYRNPLREIPEDFLKGMVNLKDINLQHNELITIPDLYHINLTDLRIAGNPLECNQNFCWIRMWPWMKISVLKDAPTCDTPSYVHGKPLMEIPPTDMKCYNGKFI